MLSKKKNSNFFKIKRRPSLIDYELSQPFKVQSSLPFSLSFCSALDKKKEKRRVTNAPHHTTTLSLSFYHQLLPPHEEALP